LGSSEGYEGVHWNLDYAINELEKEGFKILESYEQKPTTKFSDMGAVMYYLKAIPWQVPDFSIDKYYDKLVEMNKIIEEKGFLPIKAHRFIIVAEKI